MTPAHPLLVFVCFLRPSPPPSLLPFTTNSLFKNVKETYRHKKKIYKEEMERIHDNASAFMYLNINTNK